MDVSYVTAIAALGGAALGGFTSFATSWTTLRIQMKAEQNANSKSRRQNLYKQFIDEASKIYGDALIHDTLELSGLIGLYSLISRMRILSSEEVIQRASRVARARPRNNCSGRSPERRADRDHSPKIRSLEVRRWKGRRDPRSMSSGHQHSVQDMV